MLRTLRSRIYAVAALAASAALLLGVLLLQSSYRSRDAVRWVSHTQEVIIGLDSVLGNLGEAESGLRGYLLTKDTAYLARFDDNLRSARTVSRHVSWLVRDNPPQEARAVRLDSLVQAKTAIMIHALNRDEHGGIHAILDPRERAHGKVLMDETARLIDIMRDTERRLLDARVRWADGEAAGTRTLLLVGCPLLALLIGAIAWLIRTSISRPLSGLLDAVTRFGAGDHSARASTENQSNEFRRLSLAYNAMADSLVGAMTQQSQAETELARANAELLQRGRSLERRQQSIETLSEMSHRLQAIQGEGELAEVLDCFLPKVFPDLAGALYVHNHSRNLLMRISSWGDPAANPETFGPADCWGLRRGQAHSVDRPGADIVCAHAASEEAIERRCEPVLAGGEVLGLFYIEGRLDDEQQFRLGLLMENVALALVNENLRSRLREQSIRDPLTRLFNRRYMEEAFALEAARAERNGTPLSIVMADVDHFKRFNDGHGHQAGDALLRGVAGLIQSHFRFGDIVCRYGGEEFIVIAPGASADMVHDRVETLRRAVRELTIEHDGQRLGPVTASFGIDTYVAGADKSPDTLIGEADRALFRAKRLGRDRVEVAPNETAVLAAE